MSENDTIKLSDELNEDTLFVESDKVAKVKEPVFVQQTLFDLGIFDETSGFVEEKKRIPIQKKEKPKDFIEELFEGYDFIEDEKQIIKSDALLRQAELAQDGEFVSLEEMMIDVIAEYQAKKEAYEKTLIDLAEERIKEEERRLQEEAERKAKETEETQTPWDIIWKNTIERREEDYASLYGCWKHKK